MVLEGHVDISEGDGEGGALDVAAPGMTSEARQRMNGTSRDAMKRCDAGILRTCWKPPQEVAEALQHSIAHVPLGFEKSRRLGPTGRSCCYHGTNDKEIRTHGLRWEIMAFQ